MYIFLSIVYVLVCVFLIFVVLLQQGRGGGMGGAFGGSSQTVFGGSGAGNVLTRATTASAALFMILSAVLAWMSSSRDSNLEDVLREVEESNRSALLEAAEDSSTDDGATDDGAAGEGAGEPAPSDEPTAVPDEGGAPSDPTAADLAADPTAEPAPEGTDLPALEPVEPGVPALADPTAAPAADEPAPE